jgi:hypothetical protein
MITGSRGVGNMANHELAEDLRPLRLFVVMHDASAAAVPFSVCVITLRLVPVSLTTS